MRNLLVAILVSLSTVSNATTESSYANDRQSARQGKAVANQTVSLTDTQGWMLGCSAVLFEKNHSRHDLLGGKQINPRGIAQAKEMLKGWSVNNRNQLYVRLSWLGQFGDRQEFNNLASRVASLDKVSYQKLMDTLADQAKQLHKTKTVRALYDFVGDKSILGWDYGRFICLCRWGYLAGYISEQEAWNMIATAAQKLQQTFDSWHDLGANYLVGRAFIMWDADQLEKDRFDDAYQRLIDMPTSPWNKYDWDFHLIVKPENKASSEENSSHAKNKEESK